MKFTCKKAVLNRILNNLDIIASQTFQDIPLILIETSVKEQAVRFRSSIRLLRGVAIIRDDVIVEGRMSCCVNSSLLSDAVKALRYSRSDDVVVFIDDEGHFKIRSVDEDAEYTLGLLSADKLARFDEEEVENSVSIGNEEFRDLINRTKFACATRNISDEFPMKLIFGNNKLKIVSLSGIRLVIDHVDINSDIEDELLVDRVTLDIMQKMANSKTGKVKFGWSENSVRMKCDEFVFTGPKVFKNMPDHEAIFSIISNNDIIAEIEMTEFRRKLEPFKNFVGNRTTPLKLTFHNNVIEGVLDEEEFGKVRWDIDCKYSGDPFTISLSPKFLSEFAKYCYSGTLRFKMASPDRPILIEDVDDPDRVYMLSPIYSKPQQ